MSEPDEHSRAAPISTWELIKREKADPVSTIAIGIFILAFLALMIFAVKSPESWLVKFLGGFSIPFM